MLHIRDLLIMKYWSYYHTVTFGISGKHYAFFHFRWTVQLNTLTNKGGHSLFMPRAEFESVSPVYKRAKTALTGFGIC